MWTALRDRMATSCESPSGRTFLRPYHLSLVVRERRKDGAASSAQSPDTGILHQDILWTGRLSSETSMASSVAPATGRPLQA